jgi:uncharacterized protein
VRKPLAPFVGYLVAFYLTWTIVWVHGVYPWATRTIGGATLTYALVSLTFRFLIWILPVFAYLRYIDDVDPFEYLLLKLRWRHGILTGAALSVLNFIGTTARVGMPHITTAYVTWNSILGTSILVGFFEEIPFRGFMLRKLQERFDFWTSALISSLLFVAVHVPGWAMIGTLTARNVVSIFLIGSVLAIVVRYAKSLWAPIVAHSMNDFMSYVVFHI